MSWTDPYSWSVHPIPLASGNEIVNAWSERIQALGGSAVAPLADGDDAQDGSYWGGIQSWCEANCTSFIDHVLGPMTGDGSAFLYFTLDTWRAAAGLTANGFSRCLAKEADGVTPIINDYGIIQSGDCHGPWNFKELQQALGALKWSVVGGTPTNMNEKRASTDQDDPAHYAAMTAAWPDALWTPTTISSYGMHVNEWNLGGGSHAYMNTWRWKSQYSISGLAALNAAIDFYIMGNSADVDGIGFTVGQLYKFLAGKTYFGSGSFTTTEFLGDFETYPWTVLGVTPNYSNSDNQAFPASWAGAVLKWDFSNS